MSTEIAERIASYFAALDEALDILCSKDEGKLDKIFPWAMAPRHIIVGVNTKWSLLFFRVSSDNNLESDSVQVVPADTFDQIMQIIRISIERESGKISRRITRPEEFRGIGFWEMTDLQLFVGEKSINPPAIQDQDLIGYGDLNAELLSKFTTEEAKEVALNLWNNALLGSPNKESVIIAIKDTFETFSKILRRKSFLERRIHRFIRDHAKLLLPPYERCFFEHSLYLDGEKKVADFILDRGQSMPALLIELEPTSAKMFRKDGEPTQETNHGCNQIHDWVEFIKMSPGQNASGDFKFLLGEKDRLVVIGRKKDNPNEVAGIKHRDTVLWTYDLLLEQARKQWTSIINQQRGLLGLKTIPTF